MEQQQKKNPAEKMEGARQTDLAEGELDRIEEDLEIQEKKEANKGKV